MRKVILTGVLAAGLLVTLAAASPPPAPAKSDHQCFWTNEVNNFTAADDRTVYVRVGVSDVYRLDLFGPCPNINWNQAIALESRPNSSICSPLDATVITQGPTGPQRCPVTKVTKLTPEEILALPKKHRP